MAVRTALGAGRPLPPRRFVILISVSGWVDPRAVVRLEGLRPSVSRLSTNCESLDVCIYILILSFSMRSLLNKGSLWDRLVVCLLSVCVCRLSTYTLNFCCLCVHPSQRGCVLYSSVSILTYSNGKPSKISTSQFQSGSCFARTSEVLLYASR
jgi:hypothetical protein